MKKHGAASARKLRLLRQASRPRLFRARQAAIGAVGGRVGGGMPTDANGNGFYLVFIQHDGSGTALRHAAIRLNQLPQVDVVGLDYRITVPRQR